MAAESGLESPGLSRPATPPDAGSQGQPAEPAAGGALPPEAMEQPAAGDAAGLDAVEQAPGSDAAGLDAVEQAPGSDAAGLDAAAASPAADRPAPASALAAVEAALRADPHSFSFFQAVRLLERLRPERATLGGYGDPGAEVVRFGVLPSLAFPASEIQALDIDRDGPAAMKVNFMGATGPQGVLPHEYTLLVADRLRSRDTALADFLDMFHHRLISLFYRAWRKYRFAAASEAGRDELLAEHVLDLIGVGPRGARTRFPFPVEALITRAGLLLPQARGAAALQQLLEDYFGVSVEVEQFVGGWFPLESADRCAVSDEEEQPANQLGLGAVAGEEVWDQQAKVRIRLGPLDRTRYDTFLPGGSAHQPLAALLRFFSHDQYEFEVQLVLAAADVPGVRLGGSGRDTPLPRLVDLDPLAVARAAGGRNRFHPKMRGCIMNVDLRSLIGKLNDDMRNAVEAAAGLCLSRTHYDVEIEHILMKLLDATDTDLPAILRAFGDRSLAAGQGRDGAGWTGSRPATPARPRSPRAWSSC